MRKIAGLFLLFMASQVNAGFWYSHGTCETDTSYLQARINDPAMCSNSYGADVSGGQTVCRRNFSSCSGGKSRLQYWKPSGSLSQDDPCGQQPQSASAWAASGDGSCQLKCPAENEQWNSTTLQCESLCGEGEIYNEQTQQCEPEPNTCDVAAVTAAHEPLSTSDTYTGVRGEYATTIKTGELKTVFCADFCEVHKTFYTTVTRIGSNDYSVLSKLDTVVLDTLCESTPGGGYDNRQTTSIPGKGDPYGSFDPPAGGCPKGSVYGQINGKDKCVISGSGSGSGDNGSGGNNSNSTDTNGNGIPDHEDPDIDGDGIPNESDDTPYGAGGNFGSGDEPFTGEDTSDFYDEGGTTEAGSQLSYSNVFSDFRSRMENVPVIQGIQNFFALSISGSCPVYTVSTWIFSITFDQWCSNIMPWTIISGIMLAVASFLAVRIAFT